MLNHLFKSSAGFQWGVRASAFLVLGVLLFANLLMKPRPHASTTERPKVNLRQIMTDIPYLITVFSWVGYLNIVLITSIILHQSLHGKRGYLFSVCVFLITWMYIYPKIIRFRRFLLAIVLYPSWNRPSDCILLCKCPFSTFISISSLAHRSRFWMHLHLLDGSFQIC